MAITKRCDRCGKHMDSDPALEVHLYMDEKRVRPVEVELCQRCRESLEMWFESVDTMSTCTPIGISARQIAEASANAVRAKMGGDAR